jgi:hypothetical protein
MPGKDDTSKTNSSEEQSYSSDDNENPFMCLVDAATSILDKNGEEPARKDNGSPSDQDLNQASKETSRPSSPSTLSKNIQDEVHKKFSFAEHLMAVLDDESNSDILTWMPDGSAFTIINPKKFTLVDMPKLFNIRNMSSFVRKLGRWGFHRVHEKETRNSDIFKHEFFQRGNFELCAKIKCVGRKESPPSPKLVPTVKVPQSKPKHLPSVAKSLAVPVSPPTPPKSSARAQEQQHALNYLNRARAAQEQLQHRSMASSSSLHQHPSSLNNMTSEVLNAALETLHRDQTPRLPPGLAHLAGLGGLGLPAGLSPASASGLSTVDLLAIQRLIKAEQMAQQHARMPAYLTAAELHALQNNRANVWGAFPGLF